MNCHTSLCIHSHPERKEKKTRRNLTVNPLVIEKWHSLTRSTDVINSVLVTLLCTVSSLRANFEFTCALIMFTRITIHVCIDICSGTFLSMTVERINAAVDVCCCSREPLHLHLQVLCFLHCLRNIALKSSSSRCELYRSLHYCTSHEVVYHDPCSCKK